jgi:hypothetical protein
MFRRTPCGALAAALLCALIGGCDTARDLARHDSAAASGPAEGGSQAQTETDVPKAATTVVVGSTAAQLSLATSRTLYQRASAAVLVAEGDRAGLSAASATAVKLGVPLLVTPKAEAGAEAAALRAELGRLQVRTVVPVGAAATGWANRGTDGPAVATAQEPPAMQRAAPLTSLVVLALDQPAARAALATARASGARILVTTRPDPRTDPKVIKALTGRSPAHVLALGAGFGPAARLRQRIDVAATGVQLPGGGQVVFPGRRMVALYGHPGSTVLGSLGEQPVTAAIARARRVAAGYRGLSKEPVIPAFEIIATVASSSAGPDGDYSSESPVAQLRPWVDAARRAGVYVMLDLQPGHTDFLTQAKRYAELLAQPHVGLALDPEWRLGPGQKHMVNIGSVRAAEINKTADWLADLTRRHRLPQKVLMIHQFRLDMVTGRAGVRTSHDELRVVIHVDGFGTAGQKYATWNALRTNAPRGVLWGWKNFYDEDKPTFTPKRTAAVRPAPVFVSYQ